MFRHPPPLPHNISLFCLVAWVKFFLSNAPPCWAFTILDIHPRYLKVLRRGEVLLLVIPYGMPLPTLYKSTGPLVLEGFIIHFIALPPWIHTLGHIHSIPHSSFIPFPLPGLLLGHFKTHVSIHNPIVSPQAPRRCCHSGAGYGFGRRFIHTFSSHF